MFVVVKYNRGPARYSHCLHKEVITFRSLKAVELHWLDVDDQIGHFFCGKGFAACGALRVKKHQINIKKTKQKHPHQLKNRNPI